MNKTTWAVLLITGVFAAMPLQAQKLKDAFIDIKEKELRKEYANLAMLPVVATPAAGAPEEVLQLIEKEILEIMEDEDFQLLPAAATTAIRDQLTALYAVPGAADNEAAIAEHTLRELFFRHPVDGLLSVQVLPVGAAFRNDKAEWAGTSQSVESKGDGFFGAVMGTGYEGTIAASAIHVTISDRSGRLLYNWMGGVEVMMQRDGEQLEPLPPEALWQSQKRIRNAVKYALKPL